MFASRYSIDEKQPIFTISKRMIHRSEGSHLWSADRQVGEGQDGEMHGWTPYIWNHLDTCEALWSICNHGFTMVSGRFQVDFPTKSIHSTVARMASLPSAADQLLGAGAPRCLATSCYDGKMALAPENTRYLHIFTGQLRKSAWSIIIFPYEQP